VARADNPNKERITLLEKYQDDREDIQTRLYKLIEFAGRLRISPQEIEKLVQVLKPLDGEAWAIRHEIEKLQENR